MAELLELKVGDLVRMTTPKDHRLDASVVRVADGYKQVGFVVATEPLGFVILKWSDGEYRDTSNRIIKVERPVYVKAVLKRMKTDDGVMELNDSEVTLGKTYQMQLNSVEIEEWGHVDHPHQFWKRATATFTDEEGFVGKLPLELFDFEKPN